MGLNWVCSKLREWVGTVTGKGDRWGRDIVGRSAPAFLAASTTALPHLPALHGERQANCVCSCCFAARPAICGCLFLEACAGRRICWLCLPAVPCSAGCVPVHPLPAMPTALISSRPCSVVLLCPVQCSFCFAPCSFHVRQDRRLLQQFASCKTVLLAAATRACSGGPCAGSI